MISEKLIADLLGFDKPVPEHEATLFASYMKVTPYSSSVRAAFLAGLRIGASLQIVKTVAEDSKEQVG